MGRKKSSSSSNSKQKGANKHNAANEKKQNKKIEEPQYAEALDTDSLSGQQIKKQDKPQAKRLTKKKKIEARKSQKNVSSGAGPQDNKDKINEKIEALSVCNRKDDEYTTSTADVASNTSINNELSISSENKKLKQHNSSNKDKEQEMVADTMSASRNQIKTSVKKKKSFIKNLWNPIQKFFWGKKDETSLEKSRQNRQESVLKETKIHTIKGRQKNASPQNSKHIRYQGLPNIGLTCYMNSTLQCLLASKSLMLEINAIQQPGEVTILLKTIYSYTHNNQKMNKNFDIRNVLRRLLTLLEFQVSEENDAHAFYMTLINRLIEEHKPLDKFFFGEFRVTAKCDGCGPISPFEESFTELVLPSKSKCSKRDLATCIDFCFKKKRIECYKCSLRKILKPRLSQAPEILVILFERNAREDIQIKETVQIPKDKERIGYNLLGFIEYDEYGNGGHYTAITRRQINEGYYRYNDSYVCEYSFEGNSANTPLLCFYEKVCDFQ